MPESIVTSSLDFICKCGDMPDEVKEVYKTLKYYDGATARAKWIKDRKIAWDAMENEILTEKDIQEMSKLGIDQPTINKIVKGVQGASAIVTDQKPELKFNPIGKGDLYVAELLKRANDVVWEKNEGQDETYRLVEEAKVGAQGMIGCWFDVTKGPFGRIIFAEEDPTNFYWDPKSRKRDFSDTHMIKAIERTPDYIKSHYPGIKEEDIQFSTSSDIGEPTLSEGLTSGDNYAENVSEKDADCDERPMVWEIEAWMLETVPEYFGYQVNGMKVVPVTFETKEEADAAIEANKVVEVIEKGREVRRKIVIVGKKVMSNEVNPEGVDADGEPIIDWAGLPHHRTRTAYPMSPTNYAVESNRDLIKRRAQLTYAVTQLAASPVVRPKNAVWQGQPGTPGSELIVDQNAAFQPYRLGSGAANVQLFGELEQLNSTDVDNQYDLSDVMRGNISERIAWQTVYALQEFGAMMSKPFLRALESALVRLGKSIIAKCMRFWSRDQWERLIEDSELYEWLPEEERLEAEQKIQQAEEQGQAVEEIARMKKEQGILIKNRWLEALNLISPIDGNPELSIVDIDVKITAGSSMPTNRMAKLGAAIELRNAQIFDTEAALDYIDDPNKDSVVERQRQRERAELQAQQQQIQQQGAQ